MNIHEHQAKDILKKFGAPVPNGEPSFDLSERDISQGTTKEKEENRFIYGIIKFFILWVGKHFTKSCIFKAIRYVVKYRCINPKKINKIFIFQNVKK